MPDTSDWSDSENEKDNQARAPILKRPPQSPQSSTSFTSYASEAIPLRRPNTYLKVITFGRGKIAPFANRTNAPIGCGCRLNIDQTSQERETILAVVPPSDKIIHTDRVQTYDEIPAPVRPRHPLANWTSVRLELDFNRPTDQEISEGQLQ